MAEVLPEDKIEVLRANGPETRLSPLLERFLGHDQSRYVGGGDLRTGRNMKRHVKLAAQVAVDSFLRSPQTADNASFAFGQLRAAAIPDDIAERIIYKGE